jgi:iron complex outermembrane recepter protein
VNPDRLYLTFGIKVENSIYNGYGIEPSFRLAWTPSNRETFWTAVSRAERSPARKDTNLVVALAVFPDPAGSNNPVEVTLNGNPKAESEHVIAYEAGYRAQPMGRLSIDVSTFFNRYDHRITLEPGSELFEPSPAPARFRIPMYIPESDVWHNGRRRGGGEFEDHESVDIEFELLILRNAFAY